MTPEFPMPKVLETYIATINQDGGATAPTATVILNTFTNPVTWTRSGVGVYACNIDGITEENTVVFVQNVMTLAYIQAFPDEGSVGIQQRDFEDAPMDQLILTSVMIIKKN